MAWSHHQRMHLPYPPEHLCRSSATQHLRWCNHIWRFRAKYGCELLGHVDEGRMARFAHLPVAVSDIAPSSEGTQAHTGDLAGGTHSAQQGTTPRGRTGRKRHRTPSPTPEEISLQGPGPASLPFGAPPTEAMHAASAASVRKEQAMVRSNRPRSPAKKPRGPPPSQQAADARSLDKGPQRRAPQQSQPQEAAASGSVGTGIPPPPYVRAAARRASAPKPDSTTGESYYYSSSEEAAPVQAGPKQSRTPVSSRKEKIKPLQQTKPSHQTAEACGRWLVYILAVA
eukprot:6436411-Amphidinium_carterae.1